MTSLVPLISKYKVSSVLNRDTKQYGKQHLFDNSDETCWNSDQGLPQFILLEFQESVCVHAIELMFQGGFVGKECELLGQGDNDNEDSSSSSSWNTVMQFYPNDSNDVQRFTCDTTTQSYKRYKVVFQTSTDFFGRITIYKLDLLGISGSSSQ